MTEIKVTALAKRFESRGSTVAALSDINLTVKSGEFISIVGPSGCGKSTFLYLLGGFLKPDGGVVCVDGKPVSGPGTDRGVVFQEFALFPWLTVSGNISYGLETSGVPKPEREAIVRQLVSLIGLRGFEDSFPRELSGGMKQRVAIARTLAYDPNILLLDEPLGALDAQTREVLQDELLNIWRSTQKTVVMITHDVNEAVYLSQRVLVMSQRPGCIVEEFNVNLDRSGGRENVMLSDDFNAARNQVWLSVRRQSTSAVGTA